MLDEKLRNDLVLFLTTAKKRLQSALIDAEDSQRVGGRSFVSSALSAEIKKSDELKERLQNL